MNISRFFILRPVATTLLMLALLLSGFLVWRLLPVSALPQVDYPIIQVYTFQPGANPDTVQRTITAPLEREMGKIAGLKQMSSSSSVVRIRHYLEDIQDSLNFLKTLESCDASAGLGVVGYCLGGKLAYLAGCRIPEVACAVGYYGVGIEKTLDELENAKGRVVLHIAELDKFTPPEARQKILDAAAQYSNVQAYVYEGVDHAFARPNSEHYHKPSARFAHERSITALHQSNVNRHLYATH